MSSVKLAVPFLSQLDNQIAPLATCNLTSVAMCFGFFGHPMVDRDGTQLEDRLSNYCFEKGIVRGEPLGLERLIREWGYKDDFQANASWSAAKKWLEMGNPLIAHGWFTRSGHIIVICGYNERGFIVNVQFGEWYAEGFDTTVTGEGLTYSYGMMERICGPTGDLWLHFVSK